MDEVKIGESIETPHVEDEVAKKIVFISSVVDQVKKDKSIMDLINEALCLSPPQIKDLTLNKINMYLIMIPKALIYYQDSINRTQISLDRAENEFDDVIANPSYNIPKESFGKGITTVSEKMRLAKMRELFPEKYNDIITKTRKYKNILNMFEGHVKHLQTFNDNIKRIRESYVTENKFNKE